jgi:SAM-dependent methyltransferase
MFDSYEEIFMRRADRYQRAMAELPFARDAEFAAVAGPLGQGPGTVFDMPAGGGYLRRHLPPSWRYVAVEPTSHFIEQCPEDATAERILCHLEAVPRPDGAADAVVSLAGLHHVPDLGILFREFRRLLRAGAMLVIADVAEGSGPAAFLNGYVDAHNPAGHAGRFLAADLASILCPAGFAILSDAIVEVPWRFGGAAAAGAYCSDLFGIDGQPPLAVARALLEIVGGAGGEPFVVDWKLRRLVCRAI